MKTAIGLTAIVGIALGAFLAFSVYRARTTKTIDELVTPSMTFANSNCTWPTSVEVSFRNNGQDDITRLKWEFSANQKGHSSELVSWYSAGTENADFLNPFSTDLIIKPGSSITVCSAYPLRNSDLPLDQLDIRMSVASFETDTQSFDRANPTGNP